MDIEDQAATGEKPRVDVAASESMDASHSDAVVDLKEPSDNSILEERMGSSNVLVPPPPPPCAPTPPPSKIGSLDFERVINTYSIQATKERHRHYPRHIDSVHQEDHSLLRSESNISKEECVPSYGSISYHHRSSEFRPSEPTGYTGRAASRWGLVCGTGLLTGVSAIFIVRLSDIIVDGRSNLLDFLADRIHAAPEIPNVPASYRYMFVGYLLYNLALALMASTLCHLWAPEAVGSGIPEVKACLNGVRVRRFTSRKLYFVKIVATIMSVSSGLAVGPEGPLVHVGAVIGASFTKLGPSIQTLLGDEKSTHHKWLSRLLLDLSHFCTDGERRDMISVGAAAGFASAFGAPIGGLLFSLEEASTFFGHVMLFKTLTATALATFCMAVYRGNLSEYSVISLGTLKTPDDQIFLNRFAEIPLYVLLGAGGGLLGALFCHTWKVMNKYRKRLGLRLSRRAHILYQLFEVVAVSVVTSTLTFWLPFFSWSCKDRSANDDLVDDDNPLTENPEHRFHCEPGQVNELGSIFFGLRENAIKDILTDPTQFDPRTLLLTGLLFFPLMTFTLGVSLPSGIFMPTILVGSSLGGFAGICFQKFATDELSPSTFALLGAAALLAGIQRSTVSLCVILVEGTGQTKVLIPVICTIMVARYVGDLFTEDLYGIAMEVKDYPYLDHHVNKFYDTLTAGDVMSSPPTTLNAVETAQTIARVLVESSHHGFPVVENDDGDGSGQFLGLVRRDQLVALLECEVFLEGNSAMISEGSPLLTSPPGKRHKRGKLAESPMMNLAYHIRDDRYDQILSRSAPKRAPKLEDDHFDEHSWLVDTIHRHSEINLAHIDDSLPPMSYRSSSTTSVVSTGEGGKLVIKLDTKHRRKKVHVGAVMNRGTYCVTVTTPLSKAYELFTSLGLRHLIVLSGEKVAGVLTRCNLLPEFVEERTGLDDL